MAQRLKTILYLFHGEKRAGADAVDGKAGNDDGGKSLPHQRVHETHGNGGVTLRFVSVRLTMGLDG